MHHSTKTNTVVIGFCALYVVALSLDLEILVGNLTPSVPKGLYIASSEKRASYVTFCLDRSHQKFGFYPRYCSPDNPYGTKIIKRIKSRNDDGSMLVVGDTPDAIDSTILGPISRKQVRRFYQVGYQIFTLPGRK